MRYNLDDYRKEHLKKDNERTTKIICDKFDGDRNEHSKKDDKRRNKIMPDNLEDDEKEQIGNVDSRFKFRKNLLN